MKCPYCRKSMKLGKIPGDRYPLKWIPEDKYIFIFSAFQKGVKLAGYSEGNSVEAYFCEECRKVIIDIADNT